MRHSATEYEPIALPGCENVVTEAASDTPKVHPVAAMFPMMSDAELDELAADIQANGQVHPIVRSAEGQLIDGRNRLAACEIAGIEPRYTTLPPDVDPVAFILSCNVRRRQMTQGQCAMAIVQAKLLHRVKVWGAQGDIAKELGVDGPRLSEALVVARYATELAVAVMTGAMSLKEACVIAREAKAKAEGRNLDAERAAADLRRLQDEATDLADQVLEERLTLAEALAALAARVEEARRQRRVATTAYAAVVRTLLPGDWTAAERANLIVPDLDSEFADDLALDGIEARACAATLLAIAEQLDGQGDANHG